MRLQPPRDRQPRMGSPDLRRRGRGHGRWIASLLATLLLLPQHAKTAHAAAKHGKGRPRANAAAAKSCVPPKDDTLPVTPGAKVAVLAFSGEDAEPIRRQVVHVLRSKGLKPMVSLRPVDSPEQFREMAAALGLVAYVDGEVETDGAQASATVFVRSGASGLRVAAATFAGDRRQVAADVGKGLWDGVRAAFGHACADAAKPHKPEREPLRINAGAPITDADQAPD